MKLNHYFDQNRMNKKDGRHKIKEHTENGNESEQDCYQHITPNKIRRKNLEKQTLQ